MMTYFTCNASAITPAAIGAAALVPVNESVHLLLVNIVAYQLLIFSLAFSYINNSLGIRTYLHKAGIHA